MSIQTIKDELLGHLKERVIDGAINENNYKDAHHHAFNEDYYIIGYYNAEYWLKSHNMSAFEAIQICIEYERDNFGEVSKVYDNAETTVNMLVYVMGQDVTPYADSWDEFKDTLDMGEESDLDHSIITHTNLNGSIEVSDILNGQRESMVYYDYSESEAIAAFKDQFSNYYGK